MFDAAALERRVAALESRAAASLRFGRVTGIEGGQARVELPDGDGVVSCTLPTVQRRVLKDQEIKMPDVGEPVAVLCSGQSQGQEDGLVLGAVYSPTAADPGQPAHMEFSRFSDGTVISYDREAHKLVVSVQGEVEVYAKQNIKVTCDANITAQAKGEIRAESESGITLKAPFVKICGLLTVTDEDGNPGQGVLSGDYVIRHGGLAVPDRDVTAGAVSLRGHQHENSGGIGIGGTPVGGK